MDLSESHGRTRGVLACLPATVSAYRLDAQGVLHHPDFQRQETNLLDVSTTFEGCGKK